MVCLGFGLLLLITAASSDPIEIWVAPTEVDSPDDVVRPEVTGPQIPVPSDRIAFPSWILTLLPILGAMLILVVVVAVGSVRAERLWSRFAWRRFRWRAMRPMSALPEVSERELTVDIEAARTALAEGSPRNAIVACWIRLESDAARLGLSRMVAETPAEYVERVVVMSSIDPAPIRDLAALYREARFSRHNLGDDARAQAFDALARVAASLKSSNKVST